jgi:hypothetical protein
MNNPALDHIHTILDCVNRALAVSDHPELVRFPCSYVAIKDNQIIGIKRLALDDTISQENMERLAAAGAGGLMAALYASIKVITAMKRPDAVIVFGTSTNVENFDLSVEEGHDLIDKSNRISFTYEDRFGEVRTYNAKRLTDSVPPDSLQEEPVDVRYWPSFYAFLNEEADQWLEVQCAAHANGDN